MRVTRRSKLRSTGRHRAPGRDDQAAHPQREATDVTAKAWERLTKDYLTTGETKVTYIRVETGKYLLNISSPRPVRAPPCRRPNSPPISRMFVPLTPQHDSWVCRPLVQHGKGHLQSMGCGRRWRAFRWPTGPLRRRRTVGTARFASFKVQRLHPGGRLPTGKYDFRPRRRPARFYHQEQSCRVHGCHTGQGDLLGEGLLRGYVISSLAGSRFRRLAHQGHSCTAARGQVFRPARLRGGRRLFNQLILRQHRNCEFDWQRHQSH
jgi:hypothetical protein